MNSLKNYDTFSVPANLMISKKKRTREKNLYDDRDRVPAGKIGTYIGSCLTLIAYTIISLLVYF